MESDDHWIKSLMLNLLSWPGIVCKSEPFRSLCSQALSILGESSKPKKWSGKWTKVSLRK